ncbi:MAG: division/cell wall cluster transcriptional repressor MraZ [Planctomycetota bacterium]
MPLVAADDARTLLLGEWSRSLDERHRLSLPNEISAALLGGAGECVVAKERPGCLSLWQPDRWNEWMASGVELVASKLRGGRLEGRAEELQTLGRLLSTRHRTVPVGGKSRVAVPDSFRSFLGVEPGGEVIVVGAAVCLEVWDPTPWHSHVGEQMPGFRKLFDSLSG